MKNSVAIYSNGIAAFNRTYSVKKDGGTQITIPVRKANISDILGSLNIFGKVKLLEPPSFSAANANQSNLKIDSANVLDSLLTQLTGTNVKVALNDGKDIEGVLMGKQKTEQDSGTYKVSMQYMLVLTADGTRNIDLEDVKTVDFTDADIKSEIKKALETKRQGIKPESTFVTLSLASTEEGRSNTDAVLQYNVPTAAWTITYRLSNNKGTYSLEAYAVVHNNTDEDWTDFILSVVTGEPLTFESDLNEQKTPKRKRINFVKDTADGGHTAEVGYEAMDSCLESTGYSARGMTKGAMSFAACADSAGGGGGLEKVRNVAADAAEVGDFTIWTSKDAISIKSQKSALVPLFDVQLSEAKTVLYYNHTKNPTRPFRAVKFKNSTEWSLGHGPVSVYNDNMNEGNCELDACKPGEERLLLHAKETGVRIKHEPEATESKLTQISVSDGVAVQETLYTAVTTYTIKNSKKEIFMLELDHTKSLKFGNVQVKSSHTVSEQLSDGVRMKIEVPAKGTVLVTVTETALNTNSVGISTNWLRDTFIISTNPRENNQQVQDVLNLQGEVDKLAKDVQLANNRVTTLSNEQAVSFASHQLLRSWRRRISDFLAAEEEITDTQNTKIPAIQQAQQLAQAKLDAAKKKLTVTWTAK